MDEDAGLATEHNRADAAKIASWLVAFAFGVTALFHIAALLVPNLSEPSPAARHAVFIAINVFYVAVFWKRPAWLPLAYAPLAVQQSFSHGAAFLDARAVGHTDWQSVVALASIPPFMWVAWQARARAVGTRAV